LSLFIKKHAILLLLPVIIWCFRGAFLSDVFKLLQWNIYFIALDLASPCLFWKRMGSYDKALAMWIRMDKESPRPGIANSLSSATSKNYFLFGTLLILFFVLSYDAGVGQARRATVFPVDQIGRILVRRYGDYLIFEEQSGKKGTLEPRLYRVSLNSEIGPLILAKAGPFTEVTASELPIGSKSQSLQVQNRNMASSNAVTNSTSVSPSTNTPVKKE
jgi:hypothetical protein